MIYNFKEKWNNQKILVIKIQLMNLLKLKENIIKMYIKINLIIQIQKKTKKFQMKYPNILKYEKKRKFYLILILQD